MFAVLDPYLLQAEEMASKFVQNAVPRDLDVRISLPVSRLLAQVRLSLAELRLSQARQRGIHAVEDRDKERPRFPKVPCCWGGGSCCVRQDGLTGRHIWMA